MIQMTGHIPSRPFIFKVLTIKGLKVRKGDYQATSGLQKPMDFECLKFQIIYVFQDVPKGDNVETMFFKTNRIGRSQWTKSQTFFSDVFGIFGGFNAHHFPTFTLHLTQKITHATTDIQKPSLG